MRRINSDRCGRLEPLGRLLPRRLRCLRGRCSCLALLCSRRRGRLVYVACVPRRLRCFCRRFNRLPLLCSRRRGRLLSRRLKCFINSCQFLCSIDGCVECSFGCIKLGLEQCRSSCIDVKQAAKP